MLRSSTGGPAAVLIGADLELSGSTDVSMDSTPTCIARAPVAETSIKSNQGSVDRAALGTRARLTVAVRIAASLGRSTFNDHTQEPHVGHR